MDAANPSVGGTSRTLPWQTPGVHRLRSFVIWLGGQPRDVRQGAGVMIFFAVLCLASTVAGDIWSVMWWLASLTAAGAWTWWSWRKTSASPA
jgi:hypothetical protein